MGTAASTQKQTRTNPSADPETVRDDEIIDVLVAIKKKIESKGKATKHIGGILRDLENALQLICEIGDRERCWRWNWWLRGVAIGVLNRAAAEKSNARATQLIRKSYLLGARRENFDDFCVWLEIDRPKDKRFYTNRRRALMPLVQALQDLYDRKIKFLGVSLPPRTGKSTLCFFFLVFVFGHHPHSRSLCVGYSSQLVENFMARVSDLIEGEDYRWADVFPTLNGITEKSIKMGSIDIKAKPNGLPTCMFRGIDGSLTGLCDCTQDGIQYCDDLVKGYEESLNLNTLENIWGKYANQVRERMHGSMQLMVGTRWNVFDPLGRLRDMYENDPQYRFLVIPALNELDESNFAYERDGFSTEEFRELRRITGPAEWWAKFMGQPYVREGLLFEPGDLRTYNGVLPEAEPDNIIAAVDVALGGGDSVSMPIGYVYGDTVFIHDVVFNNKTTSITAPLVASKLAVYRPYTTRFEENSGGKLYRDFVADILAEKGEKLLLTTMRAKGEAPKKSRILYQADRIKANFLFLDPPHRSPEYQAFMRELCLYTITGKNKHDDAPDSLAQLADMLDTKNSARVIKVARRLF